MEQIIEMMIYMGWGVLGGVLKIIITFLKAVSLKQKISWKVFGLYCLVVFFIAGFSGLVFSFGGNAFSFIGGYAGVDLASGYERIFKKTKFGVKK
jgi:hypothetical protein